VIEMDAPDQLSRRGRRGLPLIAGALAAIVVASLIYLHPPFLSLPKGPVTALSPGPSLVQAQFSSMYSFVSATTGWGLVVGPQGQPSPSYVYRTTDGAKHWNLQLTTYPAYNPAVAGIKFFDGKRGGVSNHRRGRYLGPGSGAALPAERDHLQRPVARLDACLRTRSRTASFLHHC
jgi:hypothetical protein